MENEEEEEEEKKDNEEEEKEKKKEKRSQKRYIVSGSLCPLISFLDVRYSVMSSGPVEDNDLWHHHILGSSPVRDNDLWYHHIGRFSPFFSFFLTQSYLEGLPSKLGEPVRKLGGSAGRASELAR